MSSTQYVVLGSAQFSTTDDVSAVDVIDRIWVAGIFNDPDEAKSFADDCAKRARALPALWRMYDDDVNNDAFEQDPSAPLLPQKKGEQRSDTIVRTHAAAVERLRAADPAAKPGDLEEAQLWVHYDVLEGERRGFVTNPRRR